MAEWLLDHYPPPLPISFGHEVRSREPRDCHAEEAVRDGEIEKVVARRAGSLVELRQMLADPVVGSGIVEIALQIAHALGQPSPDGLIEMVDFELAVLPNELLHRVEEALAPILDRLGGEVDTDEPKSVGQPLGS